MNRKRQNSITHTEETPSRKSPKVSESQATPHKTKKSPPSKKDKGGKQKNASKMIKASKEDYELIDNILQFTILYNHASKKLVGVSGFSCEFLPFFAFPVLTRKPVARGKLPVIPENHSEDTGYFLGAAHPGHIRLAIIEAYCHRFPNDDVKAANWERWEPWCYQSLYYPPEVFNRKPATLGDLQEDITSGREFGGFNRTLPKVVSTVDQKLYSFAVPLGEFYSKDDTNNFVSRVMAQHNIKPSGFNEMECLLRLHEEFKETLLEKKSTSPIKLSRKDTKKKLDKCEEGDSDGDECLEDRENEESSEEQKNDD